MTKDTNDQFQEESLEKSSKLRRKKTNLVESTPQQQGEIMPEEEGTSNKQHGFQFKDWASI